jgi:hypothetical protein
MTEKYLIMMKEKNQKNFYKVNRYGFRYKIHWGAFHDNIETWTKEEAEKAIARILEFPMMKRLQEDGQVFEFKLKKVKL